MPRKPPDGLRASLRQPPAVTIPGLPMSTCRALDRLGRKDLSACLVRRALEIWDQYTRIPKRRPRRWERDPSEESGGAWAREILDEAVATLGERDARPLRRVIAKMDRRFVRTTVPDPAAHPSAPWWCRRDWF